MQRPRFLFGSVFIGFLAIFLAFNLVSRSVPSRLHPSQGIRSSYGLVEIPIGQYPVSEDGTDVIFIHGLGSNPDTTWSAGRPISKGFDEETAKSVNWVTDFLPEDLPENLRSNLRLFFYNYDSYWKRDAIDDRLKRMSEKFILALRDLRAPKQRQRSLVFVTHSYGGLLVKSAIIEAFRKDNGLPGQVQAVIFLGCPHRGSDCTYAGLQLAKFLRPLGSNIRFLQGLEYDSVDLLDMHDAFINIAFGTGIRSINFYEQRPTRFMGFSMGVVSRKLILGFKSTDGIQCVTEQSGTFPGILVENIGLGVDHYGLNKFNKRTYEYKLILARLSKVLEDIEAQATEANHEKSSVPFYTSNAYTERRSLTKDLQEKLQQPYRGGGLAHALSVVGLGGSGKTQLVLKFVEDNKASYDPLLWINADDEKTLRSSFERCAQALKLKREGLWEMPVSDSSATINVLSWLQERDTSDPEWLVIIDNADTPVLNLRNIIPRGERGTVIVTSRDHQISAELFDGYDQSLHVGSVSTPEATELVLKAVAPTSDRCSEKLEQIAVEIANNLGLLPLALDLARAAIKADIDAGNDAESAMKTYSADFQSHRDELLQRADFNLFGSYNKTIWTVWDTTIRIITERDGEEPLRLLTLLALFPKQNVPDKLFALASRGLPSILQDSALSEETVSPWLKKLLTLKPTGDWDSYYYRKAIQVLQRYSLINKNAGEWEGVTMHSLVHWRTRLLEQQGSYWRPFLLIITAATAEILYKEDDVHLRFRKQLIAIFPSSMQLQERENDVSPQLQLYAVRRLATLSGLGEHHQYAFDLHAMVVAGYKKRYGESDWIVPEISLGLASSYIALERMDEAEKLLLEILEENLADPTYVRTLYGLADLYKKNGQLELAENLSLRVLAQEKALRLAPFMEYVRLAPTITSCNIKINLHQIYVAQKRDHDAEKILLEAIEFVEDEYSLELGHAMVILGGFYTDKGRYKDAEALFLPVVEESSVWYQKHFTLAVGAQYHLASLYHRMGPEYETKAEDLLLRVIAMRDIYGPNMPMIQHAVRWIENFYKSKRRTEDLEKLRSEMIGVTAESNGLYYSDGKPHQPLSAVQTPEMPLSVSTLR